MKSLRLIIAVVAALALCTLTAVWVGNWELRTALKQVEQLNREKAQLVEYARRLVETRRVAQVRVDGQSREADGTTVTRLTWQEIGETGVIGQPATLTVRGTQIYFEAYVLKFTPQLVGAPDESRMTSLAMFRRVFGDEQEPRSGPVIPATARPVVGDAGQGARYGKYWEKFQVFADNPAEAERYGVRVAQAEAPSVIAAAGKVYELSLDAAGGINVRPVVTK